MCILSISYLFDISKMVFMCLRYWKHSKRCNSQTQSADDVNKKDSEESPAASFSCRQFAVRPDPLLESTLNIYLKCELTKIHEDAVLQIKKFAIFASYSPNKYVYKKMVLLVRLQGYILKSQVKSHFSTNIIFTIYSKF